MVKQYLEKTRDEFYESKYALIEKLTAAENHFQDYPDARRKIR